MAYSMPLHDYANHTLALFELNDIGRYPITFICHSLGVLLIKQVLRNVRDASG